MRHSEAGGILHNWAEFLTTPEGKDFLERHIDAVEAAVEAVQGMEPNAERTRMFLRVYNEEITKGD